MNQHITDTCPNRRYHLEAIMPHDSTEERIARWLALHAPDAIKPGCVQYLRRGRYLVTMPAHALLRDGEAPEGLTVRVERHDTAVLVWFGEVAR